MDTKEESINSRTCGPGEAQGACPAPGRLAVTGAGTCPLLTRFAPWCLLLLSYIMVTSPGYYWFQVGSEIDSYAAMVSWGVTCASGSCQRGRCEQKAFLPCPP